MYSKILRGVLIMSCLGLSACATTKSFGPKIYGEIYFDSYADLKNSDVLDYVWVDPDMDIFNKKVVVPRFINSDKLYSAQSPDSEFVVNKYLAVFLRDIKLFKSVRTDDMIPGKLSLSCAGKYKEDVVVMGAIPTIMNFHRFKAGPIKWGEKLVKAQMQFIIIDNTKSKVVLKAVHSATGKTFDECVDKIESDFILFLTNIYFANLDKYGIKNKS